MDITLEKVEKSFTGRDGKHTALAGVSLAIPSGAFVCLLGPSGCGKTTVLNLIAGFETPDSGEVRVDGKRVEGPGPDRVVMFQDPALFPWLSVAENVAFPLQRQKLGAAERAERVDEALRVVHLYKFRHAQPHELSGGMRARAAIARALVMEPRVMLMDEPFAALDAQTRELLQQELERVWQRTKATVVFVTHDNREAVRLATTVVVMGTRPGTVKLEVEVEQDLPRPRDPLDRNVNLLVTRVQRTLQSEIEKIAREESDDRPAPASRRGRDEPDMGRDI
ncbi:MAG: ABC transporter ATP-binding protein [Myxococcales bacterium]|nr:ABC transporter ATP-binding protein [Myxococcales bacterium]